jgi:hypothetical protein
MTTFTDFLAEEGVDYFVVEMSEGQVPTKAIINEGRWVQSGKKNWMMRVDSEKPAINQQRHVHLARRKHIKTNTMQASWNQDLTKHDRKNFNTKIGSINVVQSIAKQALGLQDSAKLEESINTANNLIQLNESIGIKSVLFKLKVA